MPGTAAPLVSHVRLLQRLTLRPQPRSGRVILSNASVEQTEYVLSGISGDATYVLYLAAADVAVPTPNVTGRREVMLVSTPLCDPCAAGLLRLPLAADCACAVGAPYEAQVGVATPLFDFGSFARALAAQLGLQLPQIAMLNASAYGDVTHVWLALLPLRPPALPSDATLNLTAALVTSGLPPATWAQPFGGFAVRLFVRLLGVCSFVLTRMLFSPRRSCLRRRRCRARPRRSSWSPAARWAACSRATRGATRC